jgi:GTP cyclohydrolase I
MMGLWGKLMMTDPTMQETPARVLRYWLEATGGLDDDPTAPLATTFECDLDQIVIVRGIEFSSLCEHHLLPFFGVAHIGYLPRGRVVGLSKLARSLDILARRPQMQERLTLQLADAITTALDPIGVAVVIRAEHTCMSVRGVGKRGAETVTSCMQGAFRDDAAARSEFLTLLKRGV